VTAPSDVADIIVSALIDDLSSQYDRGNEWVDFKNEIRSSWVDLVRAKLAEPREVALFEPSTSRPKSQIDR